METMRGDDYEQSSKAVFSVRTGGVATDDGLTTTTNAVSDSVAARRHCVYKEGPD